MIYNEYTNVSTVSNFGFSGDLTLYTNASLNASFMIFLNGTKQRFLESQTSTNGRWIFKNNNIELFRAGNVEIYFQNRLVLK